MYHYKEWHPIRTVNYIRGILENLGIMPIETRWQTSELHNYSLRLTIDGIRIGTNGKGVTTELALASAFGEFMERIQNQYLYPLFLYSHRDKSLQLLNGFYHSPDEVFLDIPEFIEETDKEILHCVVPSDLDKNESPEEYIRALSCLDPQPQKGKVLCIPYYSLIKDSLEYLPHGAVSFVYGTNGMCAGNTPEEALVQGLCEIIERYANRMIIMKDLVPPDVSLEEFSGSAQLDIVESVERNKKIKLIIKDASLGEQLPAVGIIAINSDHSAYFVKFGSHVELAVALERALTELFQGRTIEELEKGKHMAPFEYSLGRSHKTQENLLKVFVSGEGIYDSNFFGNSCSWPPSKLYQTKNLRNNREYLYFLIQHLKEKGWHILIRNVSFLGFPSFHIIIPGISEIRTLCKEDCLKMERKIKVANLLMDINACTKEELLMIAATVADQIEKDPEGSVADLTGLPYLEGFFWEKIRFNLFLSTLYLKIGDFRKSHFHLRKYISEIEDKNISLEQGGLKYYKCLRDYLFVLMEQKDTEEEVKILQRIYGDDTVSEAKETLSNSREAFKEYGSFDCPSCSKCAFKQFCFYEVIREIHTRIKNNLILNRIDQLDKNRAFFDKFMYKSDSSCTKDTP